MLGVLFALRFAFLVRFQGLPEPNSIERQKNAYARGLEEQLRHGTDVLAQQLKQQSDYLLAMGDQRKRQYALQVDQEIKQRVPDLGVYEC
eukprot:g8871.t1